MRTTHALYHPSLNTTLAVVLLLLVAAIVLTYVRGRLCPKCRSWCTRRLVRTTTGWHRHQWMIHEHYQLTCTNHSCTAPKREQIDIRRPTPKELARYG